MSSENQILVPDIGDFDSVEVIEVLVNVGDTVVEEDPLITLESDKATMDIPSPHSGLITALKVNVGDKISQGNVIAILEQAAEEKTTSAPAADQQDPPLPPPTDATAESVQTVAVPNIGDFDEVEVVEVLVKAGDAVNQEEALITLESDKATMDIPAPNAGIVSEVAVQVGDKVAEGSTILLLRTVAADGPATDPSADPNPVAATPSPSPTAPTTAPRPPPSLPKTAMTVGSSASAKAHASPSIRRFARELGVDLGLVQGSGRKNRIIKEDVQSFVKGTLQGTKLASGSGFGLPEIPPIDFSKFGEVDTEPLSRINKLSAQHLHRSWITAPHVTQFDEADITELEEFRQSNRSVADDKGVKLTLLSFLMKASVVVLKQFPRFNASLSPDGQSLIVKKYCHIGFAVDTPEGLLVPVVRDVDQKGLFELAGEIQQLSGKARELKLKPADMQGGCFTISSLGGIGGTLFTPIINVPEVAILGVSRAVTKPIYEDEKLYPRLMLPLSLSYDHRVIDGAQGARFITTLSSVLDDIRQILL